METRCEGCGLPVEGGRAGCRAVFEEVCAREWEHPASYRYHRMMVDSYCLQHAEEYCESAKSFAAHLTGLCAAFEHKSHPSVLQAVNRWLNGKKLNITRPEPPAFRGALTIAEVRGQEDPLPYAQAVDRWARSTWDAYNTLHPLAREWTKLAMVSQRN
jgi:hypothetical protein